MSRLEKILIGAAFLGAGIGAAMEVSAGPKCNHPNFYVKGCDYPELKGEDGKDGRDGVDGTDGRDGVDGRDGINGVDGRDGIAGADGKPGERGAKGDAGADGRDGIDGRDGVDGADGKDGVDGKDGTNGRDGVDGVDGRDGRDAREWRNEFSRFLAATNALDIHLPNGAGNRVTLGASKVRGMYGVGFGFAGQNEEGKAFTIGVARSGSETLVKGSVSIEF